MARYLSSVIPSLQLLLLPKQQGCFHVQHNVSRTCTTELPRLKRLLETKMTSKLILGRGFYQLEPTLGQTGGGQNPLKFNNVKNLSSQGTQSAHLTHPRIH